MVEPAVTQPEKRVVLLPVTDTEATGDTVEKYLKEAYKPGDIVHVMHVMPLPITEVGSLSSFPDGYYPLTIEPDTEEPKNPEVAAVREFLKRRVLDRFDELKIPYKVCICHYLTSKSSVGEAICCRADEIKAGLVVMPKHQKGLLEKIFVGSVSNYCVKHCRRPLLLLH